MMTPPAEFSERPKPVPESWFATVRKYVLSNVGVAFAVGYASSLVLNVTQDAAMDRWREFYCAGTTNLELGKSLRRAALELELQLEAKPIQLRSNPSLLAIQEQHRTANASLVQADKCGMAEAALRYGQAYCFGWGVQRNPPEGWKIINGAFDRDKTLIGRFITVAGSPDLFCPAQQ